MNDLDQRRPRSFRTLGVILGTVVVAGLAVVSFGSFAGADDTGSATTAPDAAARPHPQLTDEQQQCLANQGVTLPARPADGTKPTMPTDEQRAALKAAAEACGLPVRGPRLGGPGGPGFGGHGHFPQLTDEQKQCLADHGLTLGQRPADGSRDAFKAAAEACGLPTPGPRPTI